MIMLISAFVSSGLIGLAQGGNPLIDDRPV
jgi:hypothetical protein